MTACIARFRGIQRLAGDRKWLKIIISAAVLVIFFVLGAYAFSPVNAVIILLHVVAFFLLFGGIMRLIKRLFGKQFKVNLQGWSAIFCSVIYLTIGWFLLHNVWQTDYSLTTEKEIDVKIALIADSHLGTSFDGAGFERHMDTIAAQDPDMLVIAGDFVDDSSKKEDLIIACKALGKLNMRFGVWYVYGNHDRGYFAGRDFTAGEMEAELKKNGVHILKDEWELVNDSFYIVGRKDRSMRERLEISELLAGLDTSKYIIVVDHQPNDYENEAASPADLVLSGHTHGGWLFPVNYISGWLGIDDKTYGHEQRNKTDFIVTSGISDWELKFKTGTKSEYAMIRIHK